MKYVCIFLILLFGFMMTPCYGMEPSAASAADDDIIAMEEGRLPMSGRDVDGDLASLQLEELLGERYAAAVRRQMMKMSDEQYAALNGVRRGLHHHRSEGGFWSRWFGSDHDARRIREILVLVRELHSALLRDHEALQEEHGRAQANLRNKTRWARGHNLMEGILTIAGIAVGGGVTYGLSQLFEN